MQSDIMQSNIMQSDIMQSDIIHPKIIQTDIKKKVLELQKKIIELKKTGCTDEFELEMKVLEIFPEMYDSYPSLVKRLCKNEKQDNSYLLKMLDLIEQINNGERTMENVEYNLGQELANKFVYSKINNK